LLFAIVGVFEEIVQAWTWLDTAMGADGITALSPKRETAALSADMGRRMNPIRAGSEPMSITMCWIGLRKVSQNQTEPFSLRRTCAGERGYHVV
jgi:hypothetical protein